MAQIPTSSAGEIISSTTCLAEFTATLSLEVTNYLQQLQQLKGLKVAEFVSSGVFRVGAYDWEMRFYPQGFTHDCAGNASVFLWCVGLAAEEEAVGAKYTMSMLEKKSQEQVASFGARNRVFRNPLYNLWGFHQFVDKSKLESLSRGGDGCFTVQCILTVVSHESPPPLDLQPGRMLRDGIGTDVAFGVAGHEFRAHRSLLAARSPVFGAQLFGRTVEKDTLRVEVVGVEPSKMLHYIYTDSLPERDEEEEEEEEEGGYSATAMQQLLDTASSYELDRLKLICEAELCKTIDQETVTTLSALADQHSCKRLKVACDKFVPAPKQ